MFLNRAKQTRLERPGRAKDLENFGPRPAERGTGLLARARAPGDHLNIKGSLRTGFLVFPLYWALEPESGILMFYMVFWAARLRFLALRV